MDKDKAYKIAEKLLDDDMRDVTLRLWNTGDYDVVFYNPRAGATGIVQGNGDWRKKLNPESRVTSRVHF